jgi:hypothetical protein
MMVMSTPDREGGEHAAAAALTLDPAAQAVLERRDQTTRDAGTRTRYQMVLRNAQGHAAPKIAQLTRRRPDTVRRVRRR